MIKGSVLVRRIAKPSRIATLIVRSSRFAAIDELYPALNEERDTTGAFPVPNSRSGAPWWAHVLRRRRDLVAFF